MIEIFVPVIGYERTYEISNYGNVKTLERSYEYTNKNGKLVIY